MIQTNIKHNYTRPINKETSLLSIRRNNKERNNQAHIN